jgi:hypothetical protein
MSNPRIMRENGAGTDQIRQIRFELTYLSGGHPFSKKT